MPLVRDRISPQVLHAFASYRQRDGLPPPAQFHERFFDNIDAMESVVGDYFRSRDVAFISTTRPLQEQMAAGVQVYFTYDKHWAPPGHELAAKLIEEHIKGVLDHE